MVDTSGRAEPFWSGLTAPSSAPKIVTKLATLHLSEVLCGRDQSDPHTSIPDPHPTPAQTAGKHLPSRAASPSPPQPRHSPPQNMSGGPAPTSPLQAAACEGPGTHVFWSGKQNSPV